MKLPDCCDCAVSCVAMPEVISAFVVATILLSTTSFILEPLVRKGVPTRAGGHEFA